MTLPVPAYFVPRALSMALFPSMANAFGRGDEPEIRRQLDAGTRLLTVAMLPFFAAAVLLARPLLFAFGPRFASAHLILELLLAATYLLICAIPAVNSLSATERVLVRVPAAAAGSGLTVGVVSWLILGPSHSVTGIAIGYLAGATVQSVIIMFAAWRRWRQSWSTLLWRVGLAAAVATGLVIYVNVRGDALVIRIGCALAVTALTALVCPSETGLVWGRLRQVAGQARGILAR
jgi:putative peptidoglycan lipid II flippase